jgi:glycosyltransferase involved in cell wall biosynthesis
VKGIPYLLEAVTILLRQGAKVKILVVGEGSIRQDLMAQTHSLGITDNVVFLGHREDTDALLHAMDIFALPSLSEGIPMALLEAMAASRPIVASRVGGIPEIIEDGVEGYLVEPMDVNGLAERCRQLIEFPEVARKMSEQGRKRVERDFSATAMADRVASVYKELLMSR